MSAKNIEIKYLNENEYPLWNEFVNQSPQGTFFNTTAWLKILQNTFNRRFKLIACLSNDEIVAGLNFFENKRFKWKFITPSFLLPFNGPIFKISKETKLQKIIADQIEYLQKILKEIKSVYKYISLNTHQNISDLRAFTWNDFQIEPEHTYICNLENENTLLAGFNQTLRKKIQKSKEQNIVITESNDVDVFINLYNSSYSRHNKISPISNTQLISLVTQILNLTNVYLYFAKKDEEILAARIVLKDKDTIYDLLAGSVDKLGLASSFLVSEIMKNYIGKNLLFDFMGAEHPEIEKFKRAFGGELIHRFKIQNRPGLILNTLLKIRQRNEMRRRNI